RAPSGCSATNGPLVDESHRKTRHPRRRAARRAATALGRATTLAERGGVPSTGAERLQRHQRPSRRRVTPENPPPSTSSGPARGYGARPRHHPRRAARCSRDGRRAAAAPPTALSSTSHTGKPATLDVERPGARLRRSAAPPPSPSAAACPRRAPSGCSATNGPLVDESHRKTRRPRRRAARRAATALGRATTLAERPGVPSTGAERLQRHQRPSRRRVTPENPPPSTSSGPARGYGARPRHHPRRARRRFLDERRAAAAPPTALSSTSHTGKPAALDVERPGARLRRSAAPPPSPSAAAFPRRGAERLQRHQRRVQTTVKPLRTLLRGLWVQNQFPKPDTSACHSGPLVEPALPYRAVGSAGSPASAWGVRMTAAASPVWPLMGSPIGSPVASPTRCSLRHSIAFLAFSGEHRNAILIRFTDDVSVSSPDRISSSSSRARSSTVFRATGEADRCARRGRRFRCLA